MKSLLSLGLMAALALGGCGLLPETKEREPQEGLWTQRQFAEDEAYLLRLNERVKEGKLTPADRDYLWQAYLSRIQGTTEPARVRQVRNGSENYWLWPFIVPSF